MERITITENNQTYNLFFSAGNKIIQRFEPEEIEKPLHFLKMIVPSPSSTIIEEKGNEKILYDRETKLFHKYIGETEDLSYFFYQNGIPLSFGSAKVPNTGERRLFRIKNLILCCSLASLLFTSGCNYPYTIPSELYKTNSITMEYLKNAIDSSPSLTDREKEFLYNEDFLRDILPYMNQSNYLKWKNKQCFEDIAIISYSELEEEEETIGYYKTDTPNILFMKDYEEITRYNEATLFHEFIHLCQDTRGYNLMIEACAEIICNEYYPKAHRNIYQEPIKLVKILMEIIGPKAVWEYNFNSDFKPIEEKIKPYLTEEEYQEFLSDLTFDTVKNENNTEKFKSLYNLLAKIYKGMYGTDMEENEVISLIKQNNPYLVRYYFNQRMINQENSYYLIPTEGSYQTIPYEDAIKEGYLTITAIDKRPVSYEEAMKLLTEGESINREIDNSHKPVTIIKRVDSSNKTTISCIVDRQRYEDADLDELANRGIIDVNYYHIYSIKDCTYEEYQNNDFNDTTKVYLSYTKDTVLQEDGVYCFQPTKIYLPPINQDEKGYQFQKK